MRFLTSEIMEGACNGQGQRKIPIPAESKIDSIMLPWSEFFANAL